MSTATSCGSGCTAMCSGGDDMHSYVYIYICIYMLSTDEYVYSSAVVRAWKYYLYTHDMWCEE